MQAEAFFKILFGPSAEGYVCLAFRKGDEWKETFFKYPQELESEGADLIEYHKDNWDVYFCPQLFKRKKRKKETVDLSPCVWADLDSCDPAFLLVQPTVVVESSPGRFHAYWSLEDPTQPAEAESIAKRIAYKHLEQGADKSGWDLTQLLRVPFTYNFKYNPPENVDLKFIQRAKYRIEDFAPYPLLTTLKVDDLPFPSEFPFPDGQTVLNRRAKILPESVWDMFENEPTMDWSKSLFALEMILVDLGLSREEVFLVARDSACNKYARDNKPKENLWKEICRAFITREERIRLSAPPTRRPSELLAEEERAAVSGFTSFVDRFIEWASGLGDAAPQYHQAGAFIILSAILSGTVKLPTSFGTIKPNLWFMILADTTLTRKSTAMDIAADLLADVDENILLATDGSVEGLMQSLSTRPGVPSLFLRDEFSGFLEAMIKKDYHAGMAETLTKLYDGKMQKRILRKETMEIRDPSLILYTGGIKNKVCSLLTHEFVSSGFIPRFVFITAESDVDRIRPMGPAGVRDNSGREEILAEIRGMREHYYAEPKMEMGKDPITGNVRMQYIQPPGYPAVLSDEAWDRYNVLEKDMMSAGLAMEQADIMTPTYDRLCKSALKAAVLLAASEQRPAHGSPVVVELRHMLVAIRYVEEWKTYSDDVVLNVGHSASEREMDRIFKCIHENPGISRSHLMQRYHLNSRQASLIFETLEMRGLIERAPSPGRAVCYKQVGAKID